MVENERLGAVLAIYALTIAFGVGSAIGLAVIAMLQRTRLQAGIAILGTFVSGLTLPLVLVLCFYLGKSEKNLYLLTDKGLFFSSWALGLTATFGVPILIHILFKRKD